MTLKAVRVGLTVAWKKKRPCRSASVVTTADPTRIPLRFRFPWMIMLELVIVFADSELTEKKRKRTLGNKLS